MDYLAFLEKSRILILRHQSLITKALMAMFFPCFVINYKLHDCCCNLNMTEEISGKIAYWHFYLPVIHSCVIYDINFMYRYCSLQPLPHCESIKILHWFMHQWTQYYDIIDDMYILTPGLWIFQLHVLLPTGKNSM